MEASAVTSSCFNGTRIITAESSSAFCQHAEIARVVCYLRSLLGEPFRPDTSARLNGSGKEIAAVSHNVPTWTRSASSAIT